MWTSDDDLDGRNTNYRGLRQATGAERTGHHREVHDYYDHDVDLPLGLHVRVLECRTLLPHGTRSGPRSSRDDDDKTKGQARSATSADSHRRSRSRWGGRARL